MQKKNRIFMALVSILLCFVLLSTSLLSGIFARFAVRDSVQMDVGFKQWGITITDANNTLVETIEKDGSAVVRANGSITQDGLLAPGTKGSLVWLRVSGNPEVDFSIDFSGTIDFGTGFGLVKNLDETDILVKIVYDNVVKAREEKIAAGEDYSKLNYPLSLIKEMVANALNNVTMTQEQLSNLAKVHRNGATVNDLDGALLKPIYDAIKNGQYNGDVVELKRELNKVFKLRDETGKEIEYLPIIIRCVAYDVITDGEQVTLNKVDPEVLGNDCYCLKRVDNLGKVHYFADPAAENISTLENFMNGDDEGSLNTALDTPYNRTGTEIDRIYSVEWEWFYHYATEAEIDAGSVTNNRDSTAVGDYQTADLDTQLGEMIAKYPEFFDINLNITLSVSQFGISEDETTNPEDETTTPVTPPKPNSVDINWKDLYDEGLMRSQWLTDIGQAQNDYDSKFTVTATDTELTSAPKDKGADRTYFSTKMYEITSDTRYEYTFEAKNNLARGYAGVIFAYDINGHFPYFAFGEFDNISDKGSCIHLAFKKGHFNTVDYPACAVGWDEFTKVVKQTDDGYGQYKVIYDGFDVKFCYLDTSGEYVQLGSTITLPAGSKVCVGVYSPVINEKCYTVSIRNCVLTAMDDETIDYLEGENISLVKEFTVKVATFNIRKAHFENPQYRDYTKIVAAIKASGADIIFLQEVDYMTNRSGGIDQAGKIAKQAGYDYHWTYPAFDFDGGSYGVAIISKYMLKNWDIYPLSSGTGEQRILARVGITVDNEVIQLFVTQLSWNGEVSPDVRAQQFAEVAEKIAEYDKFDNVILAGDFNTDTWTDFDPIVNNGFLLVNKPDDYMGTYPYQGSYRAFDNIVHSKIFTASDRGVINNGASDHLLFYATLTYSEATLTDDG